MGKERKPAGAVIYAIRRSRMKFERSRREGVAVDFQQVAFFKLLNAHEKSLGLVRIFNVADDGDRKRKIREIERHGPSSLETPLVLQVLGLPPSFLEDFVGCDLNATVSAAENYWSSGDYSPPSTLPSSKSVSEPEIKGFLRTFDPPKRPAYRERDFQSLDAFFQFAVAGDPVLLVLEGRKGVGKSYLVAQWFWQDATRDFFSTAISIDCSDLSLDQIYPLAFEHFDNSRRGLNAVGRGCLLVLDGLHAERQADGVAIRLPNRWAHIDEVIEHVNRVFAGIGDLAVLLVFEHNRDQKFEPAELYNKLNPRAKYLAHRLLPLDEAAGAQFLAENGLPSVDDSDRRKISARLHGLPISLMGAAQELQLLGPSDLEAYLANLDRPSVGRIGRPRVRQIPGSDGAPLVDTFPMFENWLRRLGTGEVDVWKGVDDPDRAHPHALLRLLALISGPVTHSELEEIVSDPRLPIPRLSGRSIEYLRRGELPFVVYVDERYDLHMLVRQVLLAELDQFLETGTFDDFTSRAQLEAIHWKVARMRWRTLMREKHSNANCVSIVESFVHHMLEQIRLIPEEQTNRRMGPVSKTYRASELEYTSFPPGKLINGKLWYMAFHEARRFLIDSGKASTRVHAQFEAKARILERLTEVAHRQRIKVALNDIDVTKEIAICWMHAGRLHLASQVVERDRPAELKWNDSILNWQRACDHIAVEVSIGLRRGVSIDKLEEGLAPFLKRAVEIAEAAQPGNKDDKHMPGWERGALRIITRAAEVAHASGEDDRALSLFEEAARLRALWHPHLLNGQSARHFATLLVRTSGQGRPRARALINANIAQYAPSESDVSPKGSNDIVGFLILDAALARIDGDYATARLKMAAVERHPFVRRREITYATRAELELEALRLDLVDGSDLEDIERRATQLSQRMRSAEHIQLYFAVGVLIAELLQGDVRETYCERLAAQMSRINHRMRETDLDLLEEGLSPTRLLGL